MASYPGFTYTDDGNKGTATDVTTKLYGIKTQKDYYQKLLKEQDMDGPLPISYTFDPNYNFTNIASTVVWSILATSIVYYVFIKL